MKITGLDVFNLWNGITDTLEVFELPPEFSVALKRNKAYLREEMIALQGMTEAERKVAVKAKIELPLTKIKTWPDIPYDQRLAVMVEKVPKQKSKLAEAIKE